jgi:hypothetical protein
MKMFRMTLIAAGIMAFTLLLSSNTNAQATRTWVSGVGDDLNPCSRTAPCKTLAGAMAKTVKDGEISVLDPAPVGAVTVTKSVYINGTTGAGFGSILNPSSTGVNINITDALDIRKAVRIRNLDINGVSSGLNGVTISSANNVWIEDSVIDGNAGDGAVSGIGVRVNETNGCNVFISGTRIHKNVTGVRATTTAGFVVVNIKDCNIEGNTTGVDANNGSFITIESSRISSNGGDGVRTSSGSGNINVSHSVLAHNIGAAANATVSGSTIRAASNRIYNNGNSFLITAGATIASDGDNRVSGNAGGVAPNGTITKQ